MCKFSKIGAKLQLFFDIFAVISEKSIIFAYLKHLLMKKIVVLTGAGMSVESGLKTFRDADGLWEEYPVAQVATHEGW